MRLRLKRYFSHHWAVIVSNMSLAPIIVSNRSLKLELISMMNLSLALDFLAKETLFAYEFKSSMSDKISNPHVIFKSFFVLSLFEHEIHFIYR